MAFAPDSSHRACRAQPSLTWINGIRPRALSILQAVENDIEKWRAQPEMKPRRLRWLLGLCAVMLVANNVTAAVRACTVILVGQEHFAGQALGAPDRHPCPEADVATQCLPHCTQSAKSDDQNLPADAPTLFVAPVQDVLLVSFRPEPAAPVVVSAPPVVGPSLTILFRKLRN